MDIFYFTMVITYILSILAVIFKNKEGNANLFITIVIISIFTLVSGLRSGIGDTYYYMYSYNLITPNYDIANSAYEPGFTIFFMILKSISEDPQFMILMTSLIINVCNIWVIRKYSKDTFELGVFLYMVSYYIISMNGIRQSLVASMIFLCTPLIINRRFKTYCFIIIVLSTFHISSLIMIPMYLVAIQKEWSKKIFIAILIFIIVMIFYEPVINLVYKILGDSKYSRYKDFNEGGANIVRVIVYFVPVILSYIKRESLKQWEDSNIFINITLLNFFIMAISYYNWIFARFTIYTQLYVLITFPIVIKKTFNNIKEKRVIYYFLILFYIIFFVVDCKTSGINYTSKFNIIKFFY